MRIFFLLALTVVIALQANTAHGKLAGKTLTDSLLGRMAGAADTEKVMLLTDASLSGDNSDTSLMRYARQAYELSKNINWQRGMGLAYQAIGKNLEYINDFKGAIQYHKLALGMFEKQGYKTEIAAEYNNIGNNYDALSDYPKALEYLMKALKIAEESKDDNLIASDLNNIGVVYRETGKYAIALQYYFKALKIRTAQKDSMKMASLYTNISSAYTEDYDDTNALLYNTLALDIYTRKGDKHGIYIASESRMATYSYGKLYDSALYYGFEALKICEEQNNKEGLAEMNFNIGNIYNNIVEDTTYVFGSSSQPTLRSKEAASKAALGYILAGKKLFAEVGNLNGQMLAAKLAAGLDKYFKDYKEALAQYEEYTTLKDSIFSQDNAKKIAGLETERALLVKERQIQEDNRKSKERLMFISITVLLIAIIAIVVRNFYKQRSLTAQKARLADEKENLVQEKDVLLKEKDILIKEIHHRVKNNLQVVIALLDLQTGNTSDALAKRTMTEGAARVKSISLIHRFLYQNDNITSIEYKNFIGQLFAQVVAVFKKNGQQITLNENVPETVLDIDTAVPLGLILNELMINSFKYAFPHSDGSISITLGREGDTYKLTYSDSGKGLPAGFDIKAATSMGMTIMRSLARQVYGSFSYMPEQQLFVVTFKEQLSRH